MENVKCDEAVFEFIGRVTKSAEKMVLEIPHLRLNTLLDKRARTLNVYVRYRVTVRSEYVLGH